MIQATELRIGNLVNHTSFGVVQVQGVNQDSIKCLYDKNTYWDDVEYYTPIPLTEEWLIRLGFQNEGYKKDFIGKDFRDNLTTLDFVLSKPFTKGEWNEFYTYNLEQHRFVNVKYVHQLQNLYYSLTNQELQLT